MGGSESKAANGDKPDTEENEEFHTPIANRRVQKLADPRSPTDDISRTPMQRPLDEDDDFEDPRSPTMKIARTPVPDDSDPRSPSAGRDPGPFVFPVEAEDPRSPTRFIARTPLTKEPPADATIEAVTVHQADEKTSESTTNDDSAVTDTSEVKVDTAEPSTDNTESEIVQTEGESDKENVIANSESEKCTNEQGDAETNQNTPEYEIDLSQKMEKQRIANEEPENQDQSTVVLSDRELIFLTELPPSPAPSTPTLPSKHPKKAGIRRSLKDKFYHPSSSAQRSPLATRNLMEDSPDPAYRPANQHRVGVAYQKAGLRTRMADGRGAGPENDARTVVGRYLPVMDKENY